MDFDIGSFDVVLTSYEILRERHGYNVLCKHYWHRIVVDECQELKCSTSLIASQCSNLGASYRLEEFYFYNSLFNSRHIYYAFLGGWYPVLH